MRRPRSIRNRLALVFFLITLTALASIYLYVVPPLQTSLRDEKLRALARAATTNSAPLVRAIGTNIDEQGVTQVVRDVADRANARVTLLGVGNGTQGAQLYFITDSAGAVARDLRFPVAEVAARETKVRTATERSKDGVLGEAARPLSFNGRVARVVVYSAPLGDVARNVAVIRRKILNAGVIALIFAVLAGYAVAGVLSRRIKRLEEAAENVSAGDFSRPIPIESDDELGQLAMAFNEMQAQLAQLDSARKKFIATASHELRTPIFSLGGFAELLADEDLDEATRQSFLAQIREQIARLTRLATELLDLSTLEAGSLELRRTPTDIGDLVRAVTSEFVPALAQRDSHLVVRLPNRSVRATCDPERVAQILRILIDNALTHTPTGTNISVTPRRDDDCVRLTVSDDGPGIDTNELPRIFEAFYTSDDTRGSGLGLAIARELAEQMSGALEVESSPGTTVFTLELAA